MSTGIFLLVLLAAVLHAVWNFAARKAQGNAVVLCLGLLLPCVLLLPFVLVLLISNGWTSSFPPGSWKFITATGIVHALYFLLLSAAYRSGELSLVYPVARGTGVGLTALAAGPLFGEAVVWSGALGICLVTVGVLSMGLPSLRRSGALMEVGLALSVGVAIAAYSLVDKAGVSRLNPVLYIWLMGVICSALVSLYVFAVYRPSIRPIVSMYRREIAVIGAGSMSTYLLILYAFTLGPVGRIVAVREFSVVVGSFLGVVFLKESMNAWKCVAIALIVLGIAIIKIG